jgi:hypothetical protein
MFSRMVTECLHMDVCVRACAFLCLSNQSYCHSIASTHTLSFLDHLVQQRLTNLPFALILERAHLYSDAFEVGRDCMYADR